MAQYSVQLLLQNEKKKIFSFFSVFKVKITFKLI